MDILGLKPEQLDIQFRIFPHQQAIVKGCYIEHLSIMGRSWAGHPWGQLHPHPVDLMRLKAYVHQSCPSGNQSDGSGKKQQIRP